MAITELPGLTQDQRSELRSTALSFLEAKAGTDELRRIVAAPGGDLPLWNAICELGWPAIEVPEEHGGVGGRFVDLAVLLESLGRLMTPVPFMSATTLGIAAMRHGDALQQQRWLARLAAGECTVTAALTGGEGEPEAPGVEALPDRDGWRLDGVSGYVLDARRAAAIACAARDSNSGSVMMFLVDVGARGLSIEPLETVDATRQLDRVVFHGLGVNHSDVLGSIERGGELRHELLDRAALAVACDAAGGAQRVLDITLSHLRSREQFGRPVGSFQALKHRAVDMHLRVDSARTAAVHAAAAAEDERRRPVAASIAKSIAADAYEFVAAEAIQLHGGVGYTEEYDPHLHLKRARLDAALFGDSAWHRDRIARFALEGLQWK